MTNAISGRFKRRTVDWQYVCAIVLPARQEHAEQEREPHRDVRHEIEVRAERGVGAKESHLVLAHSRSHLRSHVTAKREGTDAGGRSVLLTTKIPPAQAGSRLFTSGNVTSAPSVLIAITPDASFSPGWIVFVTEGYETAVSLCSHI
jgi:hypothetical protein